MRYAICNETFQDWDHARVCRFVAELGYKGLELAPFTLAPSITDVTPGQRRLLRQQAEEVGLTLVGLHWLLARTSGLHLTSADQTVRDHTAAYLVELARCCRDLGGSVLVFGSPAQRSRQAGMSHEEALDHAADTFCGALAGIADCGVTLCLEPLAREETDFINTCSEAVCLIERIDHPHLRLHLDVKAMAAEEIRVPDLISRHGSKAGHFHANDPNKRGPGFGEMDFVPIFQALRDSAYAGWMSVEVFDYAPNPETIARESLRYLRECASKAGY
jgi:sugar phosphate isomerase/epimerase